MSSLFDVTHKVFQPFGVPIPTGLTEGPQAPHLTGLAARMQLPTGGQSHGSQRFRKQQGSRAQATNCRFRPTRRRKHDIL